MIEKVKELGIIIRDHEVLFGEWATGSARERER